MAAVTDKRPTPAQSPPRARLTRRNAAIAAIAAVLLLLPPQFLNSIELNRLSRILVLAIAVMGVNLLTGYTGLVSLGHGVFVGIGAFAVAKLIDIGVPAWPALLGATIITGLLGLIIGLPALRIRGVHLAIVTFGLAVAFGPVARKLGSLTGGTTGLTVDNSGFVAPGGIVSDATWRYLMSILVVTLWLWLARNLVTSRSGRAMRAVRDHEAASAAFGVNLTRTKAGALAISAAMAGTAGAMQALINPFVSQDQFDAFLSLRLYAAAVLGGLGTLIGSLFGVIALIVVPALNDLIGLLENDAIVFGLGLVIISLIAPRGLAGLLDDWRRGRHDSSPRNSSGL